MSGGPPVEGPLRRSGESGTAAPATQPPKPRRPIPLGALVLGLLLVAVGVLWLLEATDAVEVPWEVLIPGGLILVGLALVIGSRTGQKTGGLVAIGVILAVIAGLFSLIEVPLGSGIGDRSVRPRSAADLERSYELAIGDLTVDLSRLDIPSGTTRVEAHLAIGQVTVIVPDDVPVLAEGEASAGQVDLLGRTADGFTARTVFRGRGYDGASRRLHIDATVGMGQVVVRR
jgi:Cell wall-active antibiotics response 4TMS YvqF